MTHGAKNGGSFSEMMDPSTVDILVVYFTLTLTQTLICIICILTAVILYSKATQKKDQL